MASGRSTGHRLHRRGVGGPRAVVAAAFILEEGLPLEICEHRRYDARGPEPRGRLDLVTGRFVWGGGGGGGGTKLVDRGQGDQVSSRRGSRGGPEDGFVGPRRPARRTACWCPAPSAIKASHPVGARGVGTGDDAGSDTAYAARSERCMLEAVRRLGWNARIPPTKSGGVLGGAERVGHGLAGVCG